MRCLLLVVLLGGSNFGQFQEASDDYSQVHAIVKVVPAESLPGLPVAVIVGLENHGVRPAMVPSRLNVEKETLNLMVVDPLGGEAQVPKENCQGSFHDSSRIELQPGEKILTKTWVVRGPRRSHLFPSPGRYKIKVRVRCSETTWLDAPTAQVTVTKPEDIEAAAHDLWPLEPFEMEVAFYLFWEIRRDALDAVRRLASEYSATTYGRYARFLLARHKASSAFQWGRSKEALSAEQTADLNQALDILARLDLEGPPESIRNETTLDVARIQLRLGHWELARPRLDSLAGLPDLPFPLSRRLEEATEELRELVGGEEGN